MAAVAKQARRTTTPHKPVNDFEAQMKNLLILSITVIIFVMTSKVIASEQDDLMKACYGITSERNKTLPFQLDSVTVLVSTNCALNKGIVVMSYTYNFNADTSLIPQTELIPALKETSEVSMNRICSNKPVKELLKYLDIEFDYYDIKGRHLQTTRVTKTDCA